MNLSTEPRFVLSTGEYKQARSSRVALHVYLDYAFDAGRDYDGGNTQAAPVCGINTNSSPAVDASDLPLIDESAFRLWDVIKNGSAENPIDKFRLHNLPGDAKTAGIFDSMLLMALKHAAKNFRG
jgi:hypothetical protein